MLIVSNYHYIREDFKSKYPSIFGLTPNQFKEQLIALSKLGTFISLNELLNFQNKPFNKNYILITFDDGLSEQFNLAKPILDNLGIPFLCFINEENYLENKVSLVHKIHLIRSQVSSEELINSIAKNNAICFTDKEQKLAEVNYSYDDKITAKLKYMLNFCCSFEEQEQLINPIFNQLFDEEKVANSLYFSKNELTTLFEQDSIGSHGYKHLPFGLYKEDEIDFYFNKSKQFYLDKFKKQALAISYPYGAFEACKNVEKIAEKNQFKIGFTMERAANENLKKPLLLSRYDCNDLPKGKQNLFVDKDIFKDSKKSVWYR